MRTLKLIYLLPIILLGCNNKTDKTNIGEIYVYSMQQPDSIVKSFNIDSSEYTINNFVDGKIVYSGNYKLNSIRPYIESFIDQSNKRSIKRAYYKNNKLKLERTDLKIGYYQYKEWDSLGTLISDSIFKLKY